MKISSLNTRLNADRGAVMVPVYPDKFPKAGQPIEGMSITMRGMESTEFTRRMKEYNRLKAGEGEGWETSEEAAEHFRDAVIALVTGWEGFDDDNGEPIPFSPDKAQELLRDEGYLWVVAQLIDFAKNRDSFFAKADAPC